MEQIINRRIKELEEEMKQLKAEFKTSESTGEYFNKFKEMTSIQDTLIELYKIIIEYKEENNGF